MILTVRTSLIEVDGKQGLVVGSDDPATAEFFQERGFEGNGYTWNGVVNAIARLEMPTEQHEFDWSPEADDLLVLCSDASLLQRLNEHVTRYASDQAKIETALANADPEMMD